MTATSTVAGVVLGAGAGSRFGGGKLLAMLDGRPILVHVVEAARAAGLGPIVVVVPPDGELRSVDLGDVRRVTNPNPAGGLSSSVRLGLRALELDDGVDIAVILPGDQPRVRPDTIRALIAAATADPTVAFIVARHADDATPNPVLARRSTWRLADELAGDRGFGSLLARNPELVHFVDVPGSNPDVDTPADLARLAGSIEGAPDVS